MSLRSPRGGLSCGSRDVFVMGRTPFDDLDDSHVLTPKDIPDRLRIDARSVRRASRAVVLAAEPPCRADARRLSRRGA